MNDDFIQSRSLEIYRKTECDMPIQCVIDDSYKLKEAIANVCTQLQW